MRVFRFWVFVFLLFSLSSCGAAPENPNSALSVPAALPNAATVFDHEENETSSHQETQDIISGNISDREHYELIGDEMVISDEYIQLPEDTEFLTKSWQEAYLKLLLDYSEMKDDLIFLLYDIDKDGIPELIVAGEYMDEIFDAVYTFRNKEVMLLEYTEDVFTADSVLYARGGVKAAPENAPGLIDYYIGPSAGAFGTDIYYNRVVIDGNSLVIDAYGERSVDVSTLNTLFDDFGRNTNDSAELDLAIKEHTHYYINDNAVSEDALYHMFGIGEDDLLPLKITVSNICEKIFSFPDKRD